MHAPRGMREIGQGVIPHDPQFQQLRRTWGCNLVYG
jgi:hypothetical protein